MTGPTGTGLLVRLAWRRDRFMLPLWIVALVATVAATDGAFEDLYPDAASRNGFAQSIQSQAVFRALYGPLYSSESLGGLTAWRLGTIGAVMLALMSIFCVSRHTRQEEETGRLELVGSAAVARLAPLTSALIVAMTANLVAGVLCTAVLAASGEDLLGAVVFGGSLAGGGLIFAGIAAVFAQLAETARATNALALAALGVAFLLRAVADGTTGLGWLGWLSPLGWVEQTRAFADNRMVVVVAIPLVAAALGVAATALNARRDLGGSLLLTRSGPSRAARSLAGPFTLAVRRQRNAILGWGAGFVLLGGVFGALAGSIDDLTDSTPQVAEILRQIGGAGAVVDAYLGAVLGVVALFAAGFGVSAMLRLRADETALLVEPVLATGVSRLRLLGVQLVFVIAWPAVLMLLAGIAAGIAVNLTLTDGVDHVGPLVAGAAVQIPAVWVVGGLAAVLVGVVPRWSTAAWAGLGVCALLTEIGPALGLPQLVLDLSPFTAVPRLISGAAVAVTPLVVLTVVAGGLVAVGAAGFRRRDIG